MRECAKMAAAVAALVLMAGGVSRAGEMLYDEYAAALRAVDASGLVDYQSLAADRDPLDRFVARIARVDSTAITSWPRAAQLAFWINVYNALTLRVVIDHYPIKASPLRSLLYPGNSIRQIPGVWTRLSFTVASRQLTLDQIEHEIIRRAFGEPRIHMALVCAARGCPPLRAEPYRGSTLEAQLDDQVRRFLDHTRAFAIARDTRTVYLSPVFGWFGSDFLPRYAAAQPAAFPPEQRAVLAFISQYRDERIRTYLARGDYRIVMRQYDWSLNEQPRDP